MSISTRLNKVLNVILVLAMLVSIYPIQLYAAPSGQPAADRLSEQRAVTATEPTVLENPITLARSQSSFQAGGTVIVTYTVRSNLEPIFRPEVAPGSNLTDTAAAVAAVDYDNDPNRIRDVLVTLAITGTGVTVTDSSVPIDQDGDVLAVNLGDVLPYGEASFSVTFDVPATAADFVALDAGAVAYGNWRGRAVSAETAPATLAPDGFAAYLTCTIDANCDDSWIIDAAGAQGNDPDAIFAFVQSLNYQSYKGSLRGARGTLWSEAGNGIDQASLLIAMLRASGIPAAYHQATLSTADAQSLISSMFPAATPLGGYMPPTANGADPVNDADLIAEARDHAWVEAFLPGSGWTMLDPTIPNAAIGDTLTGSSSGRLVELPDAIRHKVEIKLKLQRYSQFPVNGTGLNYEYPLETTLNAVELIGEPVVFAHLVNDRTLNGLVFATTDVTYTPYLIVGNDERLIEGDPFQDILTSFPFGTNFVIAEWLTFTTIDPDGERDSYERELFDDLGYEARTGQGFAGTLDRSSGARVDATSSWSTLFSPSGVPLEAVNRNYPEAVALAVAGQQAAVEINDIQSSGGPKASDLDTLENAAIQMGRAVRVGQRLNLLNFAALSDANNAFVSDSTHVEIYPDEPRIFTIGFDRNKATEVETVGFDIGRNEVRVVPHPGQTLDGIRIANISRTLTDMTLETNLLSELAPDPVISVPNVLAKAEAEGIPLERFTYGNLHELSASVISDEAKARITTVINENPAVFVLVPEQMVTLDGATEPTIGWLEINYITGEVRDTMEDGQHMAAVQYAGLLGSSIQELGFAIAGFGQGFFAYTMGFLTGFFEQIPITDLGSALAAAKARGSEIADNIYNSLPDGGPGDVEKWISAFKDGVETLNISIELPGMTITLVDLDNIGGFTNGVNLAKAVIAQHDPPLPEAFLSPPVDPVESNNVASAVVSFAADLPAGTVASDVSTTLVSAVDGSHDWVVSAENIFNFDTFSVGNATVYQNGIALGSGTVTAFDGHAVPSINTAISNEQDGTLSIYANPRADLAQASNYASYEARFSAGGSFSVTLTTDRLMLMGSTYSGEFVLDMSMVGDATGSGATAVGNFASASTLNGGMMVADGSGSLTVGGSAVSPVNGFAIGNTTANATVSANGSASDQFSYAGSADFFTLSTTPANAGNFSASVSANFADSYSMTVFAPAGWNVTLDASGNIAATPPVGAGGEHVLVVTAQSALHPDLFVSAEHSIVLPSDNGVEISIAADPEFTIPFGEKNLETYDYDVNDGRFQIPGAAYSILVTNTSPIAADFDASIVGLPAGWTIFGSEAGQTSLQLTLESGETALLGLYILPDSLPAVGTDFPFTVDVEMVGAPLVNDSAASSFTMPATPFPYMQVEPFELFAEAGSTAEFTATMTNIGNASATFDWSSAVPVNGWAVSVPTSPVLLAPGESVSQQLQVTVTNGIPGLDYPVTVSGVAPTLPYTPTTAIRVFVASATAGPIANAGIELAQCSAEPNLAALYNTLAIAMSTLEGACAAGSCNSLQRDDVTIAADALLALIASDFPTVDIAAASADSATLAAAGDVPSIESGLLALSTSVSELAEPVCKVASYRPALEWQPAFDASLIGEPITYSLEVQNLGTLTATYAVTLTLPQGETVLNETVAPLSSNTLTVNPATATQGLYILSALATATNPEVVGENLSASATSQLNVVDRYLQITGVTLSPPFVESGVSSTSVSVDVANVANVPIPTTARVEMVAFNGAVIDSAEIPLNIFAGNPINYGLNTFDTSAYSAGVYTVTVELLYPGTDETIPDASSYALLTVGTGLSAAQSALPQIVPPGDVTITTSITTSVVESVFGGRTGRDAQEPEIETGLRELPVGFVEELRAEDGSISVRSGPEAEVETADDDSGVADETVETDDPVNLWAQDEGEPVLAEISAAIEDEGEGDSAEIAETNDQPVATSRTINAITRTDDRDTTAITYTGNWSNLTSSSASEGTYRRSRTIGDVASFDFSGTWIGVGFAVGTSSGKAEIYIDGTLQETIDLYRRVGGTISRYYDVPVAASHTISVTVLDQDNPFSANNNVNIDYFDTWDNTAYPDGVYEQTDTRLFKGTGWATSNSETASGGNYQRSTAGAAWFPFTGDSASYTGYAYTSGGDARAYVDGVLVGTLDLFATSGISRTFDFSGFGAGPHVLHIQYLYSNATIDAFAQPASGTGLTVSANGPSLPATGVLRFEESHPNVLYSGVPFVQADDAAWSTIAASNASSRGYYVYSSVMSETVSFTFNGSWVGLGLLGTSSSGNAEVFIDGVSQGVIDTYRRQTTPINLYYDVALSGTHTISVTVLGTRGAFSTQNRVYIDFFEAWDGTPMPVETVEERSQRVDYGNGFDFSNAYAPASGGNYGRGSTTSIWFPFTGDSVAWRSVAYSGAGLARVYVDGEYQTTYDLYSANAVTPTLNLDGFGAGPHVLMLVPYRGLISADTFSQPGSAPFFSAAAPIGINRVEELEDGLLFNGKPYGQTASSWGNGSNQYASDRHYAWSRTAGDEVSFEFSSDWVGVSFIGRSGSGIADIYIDGVFEETVDTYRNREEAIGIYYDFPISQTRTISVSIQGARSPQSSADWVYVDFFETWDGNAMPLGNFEETDARLIYGSNWDLTNAFADASGGNYSRRADSTAWFQFTGDSVSWQSIAYASAGDVRVFVDGEFVTVVDLYSPDTITRTFSLDGLGAGPHTLQLSALRGQLTVDKMMTPGVAPYYSPGAAQSGYVRVEEADARISFNGQPNLQAPTSWGLSANTLASDGYYRWSETTDDWASFAFTGTYVAVGFLGGTSTGIAEIFIDGVSQGEVDTYRREAESFGRYFPNLSDGPHVISVTVTGTRNPFSSRDYVYLDYFDTWDGTALDQGSYDVELATSDRYYRTTNWTRRTSAEASDGRYLDASARGAIWFPFEGDSISLDGLVYNSAGRNQIFVDGKPIIVQELYNPSTMTRTLSLDGFGPGIHVLKVRQNLGRATIDTISVPGVAPFANVTPPTGVIRYEENNPAILYNGAPYSQTATTWVRNSDTLASKGALAYSGTLNDTITFTFESDWLNLGFERNTSHGFANVKIDGISQGIIDLYHSSNDIMNVVYSGLGAGMHTLEIVVLDQRNPSASNDWVVLDYIDIWDGTLEAPGRFDADRTYQDNDRVDLTNNWVWVSNNYGLNDDFYRDGNNAWFRFTGDAVTVRAFSDTNANAAMEVFIDGSSQGIFDLTYGLSQSPLPFHFDGLGAGPHVVRVVNIIATNIDSFEANPTVLDPGVPMVEWNETAITGEMINTPMAGDIDGDGLVEVVATDQAGNLIVYRGDGQDAGTGNGNVKWTVNLGGEPDSPALADLDPAYAGAEIIVGAPGGTYAYHADGTQWWFTDTVRSTWRGPNVGNVDGDSSAEIVMSGNNCICILEADGSALIRINRSLDNSFPNFSNPLPPNLADFNDDGRLDILTGDASTLYLITITDTEPALVWSKTFTNSIDGRGAPALADMDGHLVGGDEGPEIALVSSQFIILVDDDGSEIWRYPTGGGEPGGVSIADLTGDGVPEVVATAQFEGGVMFVLNADGTLLWSKPAVDTTSANSASVLDLDGDGVWEIAWNGFQTGFTIFRGSDGEVLFNEPLINSETRMDYPIIADVDGDGSAEIVTGDEGGTYVIGYDGQWAPSRPLWNQYNYHITNVNDDLSIPPVELDSWTVHNTYRTQTPLQDVLPVWDVVVTHTVPPLGVNVITTTSLLPLTADDNPYGWTYEQAYFEPTKANAFSVALPSMQPGEVRQVSVETIVEYTLPSGSNRVTLPAMYVSAAHLLAISPYSQTASSGQTVSYTVTLFNVTDSADAYTLALSGEMADWLVGSLAPINVAAEGEASVVLEFAIPAHEAGDFAFGVTASNSFGGSESVPAELTVVDPFDIGLAPPEQTAAAGDVVSYTLVLTNHLGTEQILTLSAETLANVTLPAMVVLPANGTIELTVTAQGFAEGSLPIIVAATNADGASDEASAILHVLASPAVAIELDPVLSLGGPGMPTVVTVTVTNIGDAAGLFDIMVVPPSGWQAELDRSQVEMGAYLFNSAELRLTLTPPVGTLPADYDYTVMASIVDQSAGRGFDQPQQASALGTVRIGDRGVAVSIDPATRTLNPSDSASWTVTVTNTGTVADTYDMSSTGIVALSGSFTPPAVTLAAGQSTTVQLTATDFSFALPVTYTFAVAATSQADAAVIDDDSAEIVFMPEEAVIVHWTPNIITTAVGLDVYYILAVTNTGSAATTYDITLGTVVASPVALTGNKNSVILPAHTTTQIVVRVNSPDDGTFMLDGSAESMSGTSDNDQTMLVVQTETATTIQAMQATSAAPLLLMLVAMLSGLIPFTRSALRKRRRMLDIK